MRPTPPPYPLLIPSLLLFLLCGLPPVGHAWEDAMARHSVSGHVRDASNGEAMIGATVSVRELGIGTATNAYGFYSISLAPGRYTLVYSFMGYASVEQPVTLSANMVVNVELPLATAELDEVVVAGERPNANVTRPEMSVTRLDIRSIRQIPALMGEVDVIKAIQLLPGVQNIAEGASGFSVRGGAADQNLVLLDEAPIYNAGHIMGFFSVFNNDAVRDVTLYKGDIPASHGGRLASLLNVRMRDGNSKRFSARGGIGNIASRLTLEGPIGSENTTFLLAGRRSYADLFLRLSADTSLRDVSLYFYDLNMKLTHRVNDRNRIFLSGYAGRDVFGNQFGSFGYGNQTLTARWNHIFTPSLFMNLTLVHSNYSYFLGSALDGPSSFEWRSRMVDYGLRADFQLFAGHRNTIRFGAESTLHTLHPGTARGIGDNSMFGEFTLDRHQALKHALYAMNEQRIGRSLTLRYGLRLSALQNIGPATVFEFNEQFEAVGQREYQYNQVFNTYTNLEPRLGISYVLSPRHSLKTSYSRTVQYMQQASNSAAGTPLDIWFTASPNVKPQLADQWAVGYFRNFMDNTLETSVEVYYKHMRNAIDFKDFATLLLNERLEGELRTGTAQAYGVELLAKLNLPRMNGWVSYTYSRVTRTIPGINNGLPYSAPFDKPHDLSVVISYELTPRLSLSASWAFSSGIRATFPIGRYELMGTVVPIYSKRNVYSYPNFHRLDLGLTYRLTQNPQRRWQSELNLSVYNAYHRKNPWTINFVQDQANPNITRVEKTYLPIIPSITYNFTF